MLFVNGTLDDLLPDTSLARQVWAVLNELDFSRFEDRCNNDKRGRTCLNPRRLAAVWILSLVRGNMSSVKLSQMCEFDLEFRWLTGDVPVKKSKLSAFRSDHLEELTDLSTQVLAVLARMGLLPGEKVCVDGTIIRAASSCHSHCSRKKLKQRIKRLEERIHEGLSSGDKSPEQAQQMGKQHQRMCETLEEMDRLGLRKDNDRMTATESDASMRKLKTGAFAPGHNVQAVTDLDSSALIFVDVIDQGNDGGQLAPQLEQAQAQLQQVADKLEAEATGCGPIASSAADSAYHDTLQLDALEQQGITNYVPQRDKERRPPKVSDAYLASQFSYDEVTDTMVCPEGATLKRRKKTASGTAMTYQADTKCCDACPHKHECCPESKGGRSVNRPLYKTLLDTVQQRTKSDAGQQFRKARSVTAEGVFARLVEGLAWRRCRLWGKAGALNEARWRQLTHNLMLVMQHWNPLVLKQKEA
jgi:transposase